MDFNEAERLLQYEASQEAREACGFLQFSGYRVGEPELINQTPWEESMLYHITNDLRPLGRFYWQGSETIVRIDHDITHGSGISRTKQLADDLKGQDIGFVEIPSEQCVPEILRNLKFLFPNSFGQG